MPDLLDPTNPGRGSRELIAGPPAPASVPITAPVLEPLPSQAGYPVLVFERVSKWYGPVLGVNQVTLELRRGITGLVGANGAGKTTLLRLAAGMLRADQGRVEVLGRDTWGPEARLLVGYCPEVDRFYEEMSGREFVRTMARLLGYSRRDANDRTEQVLVTVGMHDRSTRKLAGYSKGMRQRIKLAQALLHNPPLLILDEPLRGIDPVGQQEMVEVFVSLAEQGMCLLVSSHELNQLEKMTDHVAIMARGRIAAVGSVASIRDRLDDHPLTVRIELAPPRPAPFHVEHPARSAEPQRGQHRELAGKLIALPMVVSVEVTEDEPADGLKLIVRARQPRAFFAALGRIVIEDWLEVRQVQPLDDSASAVLGYLLSGAGGT